MPFWWRSTGSKWLLVFAADGVKLQPPWGGSDAYKCEQCCKWVAWFQRRGRSYLQCRFLWSARAHRPWRWSSHFSGSWRIALSDAPPLLASKSSFLPPEGWRYFYEGSPPSFVNWHSFQGVWGFWCFVDPCDWHQNALVNLIGIIIDKFVQLHFISVDKLELLWALHFGMLLVKLSGKGEIGHF